MNKLGYLRNFGDEAPAIPADTSATVATAVAVASDPAVTGSVTPGIKTLDRRIETGRRRRGHGSIFPMVLAGVAILLAVYSLGRQSR